MDDGVQNNGETTSILEMLTDAAAEAVDALVAIANDRDAEPADRIRAADTILQHLPDEHLDRPLGGTP